jgi:hypothetical protein
LDIYLAQDRRNLVNEITRDQLSSAMNIRSSRVGLRLNLRPGQSL